MPIGTAGCTTRGPSSSSERRALRFDRRRRAERKNAALHNRPVKLGARVTSHRSPRSRAATGRQRYGFRLRRAAALVAAARYRHGRLVRRRRVAADRRKRMAGRHGMAQVVAGLDDGKVKGPWEEEHVDAGRGRCAAALRSTKSPRAQGANDARRASTSSSSSEEDDADRQLLVGDELRRSVVGWSEESSKSPRTVSSRSSGLNRHDQRDGPSRSPSGGPRGRR